MEEIHRAKFGGGRCRASMPSPPLWNMVAHLPICLSVHQTRSSPNVIILGFLYGCLSCRHDWLNHWHWTQSPVSLLFQEVVAVCWGEGRKARNHFISTNSGKIYRGSFWKTKDTPTTQEIPRDLGPVSGTRDKDQHYFLLLYHRVANITDIY